jgi:hypothetical protein
MLLILGYDLTFVKYIIIEFEYQSRNFLLHGHAITGCDLIICWENNWPERPLEILELQKVISAQPALRQHGDWPGVTGYFFSAGRSGGG